MTRPARIFLLLLALAAAGAAAPAAADVLVATRTIPARTVIGPDDVMLREGDVPGALDDPALAVGMEARVALYANRPIRAGDLGLPAIVERNQIIPLIYRNGALLISTDGRALDRAGPGDTIRVMNIASRATVTARIGADGAAYVSP
jgi:flagella basal body P-ring formation protein FlgA